LKPQAGKNFAVLNIFFMGYSSVKFLPTWGFNQKYFPGLLLTEVPGWVSAPQARSRVSNINFPTQALKSVKGPGNIFD
jgi:hypothetical protein